MDTSTDSSWSVWEDELVYISRYGQFLSFLEPVGRGFEGSWGKRLSISISLALGLNFISL